MRCKDMSTEFEKHRMTSEALAAYMGKPKKRARTTLVAWILRDFEPMAPVLVPCLSPGALWMDVQLDAAVHMRNPFEIQKPGRSTPAASRTTNTPSSPPSRIAPPPPGTP
eukprot:7661603-Lingulodinium_polyedra.AAC.1